MIDVARLLGSFADTVLGVDLPALRSFLRERLGERTEVTRITSERDVVLLEDVTIPIGPRGILSLERATFAVTARLPPLRLDAFQGTLRFGDDFRAAFRFTAAPTPDENAWVWGELTIDEARWRSRAGAAAHAGAEPTMSGRALLSLGSSSWRLDGGRLEGEVVRARFAGGGTFTAPASDERLLVPRALSSAAVGVERGKVGAFCDALRAVAGHELALPDWLPLDAQLDGELSWTAADGGRGELKIASAPLRGTAHVTCDPRGDGLDGHFEGAVQPAAVVRRLGALPAYAPRDEDSLALTLAARGALLCPVIEGTFRATEVGFRLGRPRFVPPATMQGVVGKVRFDGRLSLHAMALAHGRPVELVVDGEAVGLKAPLLDVGFVRDVLRTLGAKVVLPEQLALALDLSWRGALVGSATLTTPSSALVVGTDLRITGRLGATDAAHFFPGLPRPSVGAAVVDLLVTDPKSAERGARGTLTGEGLVVMVGSRAIGLDGVTARVALSARSLEASTPQGTALRWAERRLTGTVATADVERFVTLPVEALLAVDLGIEDDVALGTITSARIAIRAAGSRLELTDVGARIRIDRARVMWNALEGRAHGGTFSTRGVLFRDRSFLATGSVKGIVVDSIPTLAGRSTSTLVRGRLDGATRARRLAGDHVIGDGSIVLHDGAFPVLDRIGPMLDRYGLTPPQQEATAPATASLRATEWGFLLEDIVVALAGATARGSVGISHERSLEGAIEVTLADDYLKKSKLLTLPRVFVDRLAVPIKIGGTLAEPSIHAEVGSTLGRALVDNRVTAWLGRDRSQKSKDARGEDEIEIEAQLDAILGEAGLN